MRVLAIDIGGTAVKAAVVDDAGGHLSHPCVTPTVRPCDPPSLIQQVVDLGDELEFDAAVVGFPGGVRKGVVVSAYQFWRLDGTEHSSLRKAWEQLPLADLLAIRTGRRVIVVNDAALHAAGVVTGSALNW